MAGSLDNDDYWNDSETSARAKAFNFEEDEFGSRLCGVSKSGTAKLSQQMRAEIGKSSAYWNVDSLSESTVEISDSREDDEVPLLSLISEENLKCVLEARQPKSGKPKHQIGTEEQLRVLQRQIENRWVPPPAKDTVIKICLGQPYSLEVYRTLQEKTNLLDEALNIGDGNAILAVVMFVVRTLKKSLVHQLLSTRPEAVTQYISYLSARCQVTEANDLLVALGRTKEADLQQMEFAVKKSSSPELLLQRLKQCSSNHMHAVDTAEKKIVDNYIKLIEWQKAMTTKDTQLLGKTAVECLAHCCRFHWGDPKGSPGNPHTFCERLNISDKQFQWVAISVRGSMQKWSEVEDLLITKNWLGGRRLKTSLPMENVVMKLHECQAPSEVLATYLQLIDDTEKKVALARKLHCHKVVIDTYSALRDRQALITYKANMNPQSEHYIYAENAILSTATKWKN